jgi:hypothetical protein
MARKKPTCIHLKVDTFFLLLSLDINDTFWFVCSISSRAFEICALRGRKGTLKWLPAAMNSTPRL